MPIPCLLPNRTGCADRPWATVVQPPAKRQNSDSCSLVAEGNALPLAGLKFTMVGFNMSKDKTQVWVDQY